MHTWFFFVRAGHALNFFSLLGRLQGIFFQIFQTHPPPPPLLSRAKWFAPNCAWRFSFKQEIRTRHEVPSWLKIDSRQPTRPRNTSLTALKVLGDSFSEAIPIFFKIIRTIHTSMTTTFTFWIYRIFWM